MNGKQTDGVGDVGDGALEAVTEEAHEDREDDDCEPAHCRPQHLWWRVGTGQ